jgi:hypothetical protein
MASRQDAASTAKPSQPEAAKAPDAQPEAPARKTDTATTKPDAGKKAAAADERPQARAADQADDLLHPTEEELRAITRRPGGAAVKGYTAYAGATGGQETLSNEQPRPVHADLKDGKKVAQAEGAVQRLAPKAADQTDDLLNPTEDERRGIAAPTKGGKASQPEGPARTPNTAKPEANGPADAPAMPDAAVARPPTRAAPAIGIQSDVDPENWAEYGGWYRQDYAIFYRPIGHKDKFIYSWLFLTGPHAPKNAKTPAAAVFNYLTSKDAQGSCTKCHSVDDVPGKGRLVNFSPPKIQTRQGRFTRFIHEPHFGVLENRGCLTCHKLEKGRPYLKSYEQHNPRNFVSNFGAVNKELCQTCHTAGAARQDCLLCHKYHVNGVITPIMSTRIPAE